MTETCLCQDEVADLHLFFQEWFRGVLSADGFERFEAALAPDFTIVMPGGELVERAEIVAAIRRHHGGEPTSFGIETLPRRCQRVGLIWHVAAPIPTKRRSPIV